MTLLPVFRVLDVGGEAPFRQAYLRMAESTIQLAWWGSFLVLLLAGLLTVLWGGGGVRTGRVASEWVQKPSLPVFSAAVGVLAFALALGVGDLLYQGLYTNLDEMASAIQARYLAAGRLTGPSLAYPEGWLITNTLMVGKGWVSQYPPAHLVGMAAFFRLGVPGLAGPMLTGLTAWFLALSFPRLLPDSPGAARIGAILVAVSPFSLLIGAGGLSHTTAGAASAAMLYATLRARDGRAWWGLAVGCAVGIMVSARPWIGIVLGFTLPVLVWGRSRLRGRGQWFVLRGTAMAMGGLPFAVLLAMYNRSLFGSVTRFGYTAAFGHNHGLGFHRDPWGYFYGPTSAFAFTSMDLLSLGGRLLETPIPLTAVVGIYLLLGPRFPKGSWTLLTWGLLPVVANALYWFHDPRMLFEAAPAWLLLAALGVGEIVRWTQSEPRRPGRVGQLTAWATIVALLSAGIWGIPNRWRAYAWTPETLARIRIPEATPPGATLVFVHSSWNERLSSRLQGAGGMRQDSIVSALRRNTNCALQTLADARETRMLGEESRAGGPGIDLSQGAESPGGLVLAPVGGGMSIRTRQGEVLTPECLREIRADRFGAVALAPLVWQGDLPGIETGRPMFVRDLGPEKNRRILDLFPTRPAYVFSPLTEGGYPELSPYDLAMELLWGEGSS